MNSIIARVSLKIASGGPEYSMNTPPLSSVSASGMSNGTMVSLACMQAMATSSASTPDGVVAGVVPDIRSPRRMLLAWITGTSTASTSGNS